MTKLKSLVPNLLTAGNLVGGVLAIIFSLTGHLEWAPYCIFISAFLDFFDGFAARLLKVQSEMGKQLDSLADMVTFGVAPGIIVYQMIKLSLWNNVEERFFEGYTASQAAKIDPAFFEQLSHSLWGASGHQVILGESYFWLPFIALIIPIMSMFRLAKFNLDTRQSDSFIGLPTPANTLFFAVFPLLILNAIENSDFGKYLIIDLTILNPWFLVISTIIMSILLVVELPLFALKFKTFAWKGNEIRYIFLTLCAAMLATLMFWAIPLIIILYILLSIIQNFRLRHPSTSSGSGEE